MAGEMSQSEVTREAYPILFEIQDALDAEGVFSDPRAFDQYQGPYLYVPGVCKVWLAPVMGVLIERSHLQFETRGSHHIEKATPATVRCGYYTAEEAAERIVRMVRS